MMLLKMLSTDDKWQGMLTFVFVYLSIVCSVYLSFCLSVCVCVCVCVYVCVCVRGQPVRREQKEPSKHKRKPLASKWERKERERVGEKECSICTCNSVCVCERIFSVCEV